MARYGLETTEINIWADRDAAAVVRSIARGNETVPMVMVRDKGLVNPSAAKVVDALRAARSDLVPGEAQRHLASDRLQIWQWIPVGVAILASFVLDAAGHAVVTWTLDAAAAALYVGFRLARRRRSGTAKPGSGR